MYGNISCHGDQVTGGFCTFTCQPGFSLMGSGRRECLSDHTWSGEDADCQRKRCADLAYSDAVVNERCETTFESTCFITCGPRYFNPSPSDNSVTCVVTSEEDNTVDWTTRPTCQGMDHFNHTYSYPIACLILQSQSCFSMYHSVNMFVYFTVVCLLHCCSCTSLLFVDFIVIYLVCCCLICIDGLLI